MLHLHVKSAKCSFDEHDIHGKKPNANIDEIWNEHGSKKRERPRQIRMCTLIVTLDTIIAVHTPTAKPKVLRFMHMLVSVGISVTRKYGRYRNKIS